MTVETNQTIDKNQVQLFSEARNEPQWFRDLRFKGIELALEAPLPKPDKTKIDNWVFSYNRFDLEPKQAVSDIDELPETIRPFIGEKETKRHLIVQQDASVIYKAVANELQEKGVIFTDMQTALKNHGELVKKYLFSEAVKIDENRLIASHAALMNGGVFIYVPKNVTVELPLQAIYAMETEQADLYNHVLIVADEHSSVTYVENYTSSLKGKAAVTVVAEVYAEAGAKVAYGAVDHLASEMTAYIVRRGHVGRDARIDWALGQMNDGDTISDNTTQLIGDNSWADAKTVTIGRGKQRQNITTLIVHHGKHSEGHILKHGVMGGEASLIFNGVTKIEHGATKANSDQTERVLMLSGKARGDANPILLIDEDDVIAGHAASVGQVDEIQLYYLMSRGLSKKEAERLIINGFLAPVVEQLPVAAVKEQLQAVIERKVEQ